MKQYKMIAIWLIGISFLWLLSRLWIGPWEVDFINLIFAYTEYANPQWPLGLVNIPWLSFLLVIGLVGWAAWMWQALWGLPHFSRPVWLVSVAIIATLLLIPQTGNYTLTLALLPIWLMLYSANNHPLLWLPILFVLASPWIFHFVIGIPALEHLVIPITLAGLLSLYLTRWKKELMTFGEGNRENMSTLPLEG